MATRTSRMTKTDVANRAKHARGYMAAADLAGQFPDEVGDASVANVVASLYVLAGIAAADAICGLALGKKAAGESHLEAASLLSTATINGGEYAKDLRRLLSVKSNAQYSADMISAEASSNTRKWATRLVAGMEKELAGPSGR